MGKARAENRTTYCDSCGEAFVPEPVIKWDEHIEYTSFSCPHCGMRYLVSVTDESLREGIQKYDRMATRNRVRRLSEKDQLLMQSLKRDNLQRAMALREMYGKEYV